MRKQTEGRLRIHGRGIVMVRIMVNTRSRQCCRAILVVWLGVASGVLGGCDSLHPLVVNQYPVSADIAVVDSRGGGYRGSFAPNECLQVLFERPQIEKMIVTPIGGHPLTYGADALGKALGLAATEEGVFTVSGAGIGFIKDYKCRSGTSKP